MRAAWPFLRSAERAAASSSSVSAASTAGLAHVAFAAGMLFDAQQTQRDYRLDSCACLEPGRNTHRRAYSGLV